MFVIWRQKSDNTSLSHPKDKQKICTTITLMQKTDRNQHLVDLLSNLITHSSCHILTQQLLCPLVVPSVLFLFFCLFIYVYFRILFVRIDRRIKEIKLGIDLTPDLCSFSVSSFFFIPLTPLRYSVSYFSIPFNSCQNTHRIRVQNTNKGVVNPKGKA